MVAEIVTMARECGASRIIIAEASGSRDRRLFEATSMTTIEGVEFMDFNTFRAADCYYLTPANSLTGEYFYIPKIYMDADVVIDTPKMKNHYMTTVTLSLKNCSIGVPPTSLSGRGGALPKQKLHDYGLDRSIVDINQIRKPDFSVVDGIIGMEGRGPVGGSPIRSNVIIAGADPVAVDTVGLTFMGYIVDEVSHVKMAGDAGLGINIIQDIKVVGAELENIKTPYKR
jgi:uncharacterized protein (DUF362 family)